MKDEAISRESKITIVDSICVCNVHQVGGELAHRLRMTEDRTPLCVPSPQHLNAFKRAWTQKK